jgi:glucose/arabinose dehydrogenase
VSARARRVAAAAAAFLAVAGCTSGDDENDSASAEATSQTSGEAARTDASAPPAGAAATQVRLLRLGTFDQPTYLTAPRGDKRRFVVERDGRIRVVSGGRVLGTPFLDISDLVTTGGESGLLSMAFAPDYARSGRFYVYYTDSEGYIRIDQFRRAAGKPNRADRGSRRLVMRVPHERFNHKGGQLQFGPDGKLYAGFGDGGGGGDPDRNGQNLSRQLAKLIRISPRAGGGYSVPKDNPFRGRSGAVPNIYAYGVRNPYRFSFDRLTGSLTIGDVGQDAVEEIDFVPNRRGRGQAPRGGYNFGWSIFEGLSRYREGSAPGARPPAITHQHSDGYCSITGGYVIRDRSMGRGLYGKYVYGDYCKPNLRLASLRTRNAPSRALSAQVSNLVSFGEDGRGRVYAISLDGPVYRLAAG